MVFVKHISYPKGKVFPGMLYLGNSDVLVEQIDKDIEEMKNTKHEWVCKAVDKKIAPTGVKLEPCPWHSNYHSSDCYTENPPTYGIWLSDCTVIDTCHIQEKINKDNEDKEIKNMENICRDTTWFNDAKSLYEGFNIQFEKRNVLTTQINSIKKEIEKIKTGPDTKNQEYVILLSRATKAEEIYNQRVETLTKSHKNAIGKVEPLEDFIAKRTIEEKITLDKTKEDVQRWYNNHLNSDSVVLFEKVASLQKLANILTSNLQRNFRSSYTYVFRAIQNLYKMKFYYMRYKLRRDYSLDDIKMDILQMESNLSSFNEFTKGVSPCKIIEEFEKEQECAIREEKAIKSGKTVQRIANSQSTFVVRLDGTLEKNVTDEQIIIGASMTSKPNTEKDDNVNWRDSNVVKSETPVLPPSDDTKWSRLR
jgi:hypothetical protein